MADEIRDVLCWRGPASVNVFVIAPAPPRCRRRHFTSPGWSLTPSCLSLCWGNQRPSSDSAAAVPQRPALTQDSRLRIASSSHALSSAPVARAMRNMPCRNTSGASSARTGSPSR